MSRLSKNKFPLIVGGTGLAAAIAWGFASNEINWDKSSAPIKEDGQTVSEIVDEAFGRRDPLERREP